MESFFKKHKKDFSEIKDRLVEFSKKIGLSVGEFKRLVSRIQKKSQELLKKEMVEANLKASNFNSKKIYKQRFTILRFNPGRKYRINESC